MATAVRRAGSLSKPKLVLCLIAVYLTGMTITGDLAIQPITNLLYEVFPNDPEWVVSFGITGMAFLAMPAGIIAGILCDRMDKKWVLFIGFAIFGVCAIFAGAVQNAYYFMVMRCLYSGLGWGLVNTAALGIIADLFVDEATHARHVGFFTATQSIMGVIMGAVAGVLALSGWTNVFYTYLMAIPIMILIFFFVPSFPPAGKADKSADVEAEQEAPVKGNWWTAVIPLTIQGTFIALIFFTLQFFISMFIADAGIGDSAFAGFCASLNTAGCCIGGLTFGIVYKKFRQACIPVVIAVIGICFVAMALSPTVPVTSVCVFLAGYCWMVYMSYMFAHPTDLVPASKGATAISIVALGDNFGGGLCSFVLMGIIGATGMNCVQLWPYFGAVAIAIAVISAVYYIAINKKH